MSHSYMVEELMNKSKEEIIEDMEECTCSLNESNAHCEGDCVKYENSEITGIRQYTGLKDKNEKEIYEGDIINLHHFTQELGEHLGVREGEEEIVGVITFQAFGLWIEGKKEEDGGYLLWIEGLHEESYEVIGNIYENPDFFTK